MEGVTGVVIEMKLALWNPSGDLLGHPARREDVVLPADDKRSTRDPVQVAKHVVRHASIGLRLQRVKRLRRQLFGREATTLDKGFVTGVAVPERLRED
jgi:hypothetical protein